MLEVEPTQDEILALLGKDSYEMWKAVRRFISDNYTMDIIWDEGGKYGAYECKFRKSGKTLCTLYAKEREMMVLIILGKAEREKFEEERVGFSPEMQAIYDQATTYHDGKWMYIRVRDSRLFPDIIGMLVIKKKPNRSITMCGYVCEMCKAFAPNIKRNDERERLSALWKKYYNLSVPPENIYCEGCRSTKADARRIDNNCPVRVCALQNKVDNCSACGQYPCAVFRERQGLSYEEARKEQGASFDDEEYEEYMLAYDNKSRLDRRCNSAGRCGKP